MNLRLTIADNFINLGRFISESLSVAVLRPDDLVSFNERIYNDQKVVDSWISEDVVLRGLYDFEEYLLNTVPFSKGEVLVLGVGGGREAIALAKRGYQVTGIDFIPEMVEGAKKNAEKFGVRLKAFTADISALNFKNCEEYDLVWLSTSLYSLIPSRKRRIAMLRSLNEAMKPGGYLVCQYKYEASNYPPGLSIFSKWVGRIILGNMNYQIGDVIHSGTEYQHFFPSIESIESEFRDAGFETKDIKLSDTVLKGLITVCKPE
ncbi:MAG: class I SAM-dependent methyltransferase [Cytophagales bacterium]|nr:class I SAM-dependent methyltransferase [Cytophagales bacterium]